jgi:hypothetical protein
VFPNYIPDELENKLTSSDTLILAGNADISSKTEIAADKIAYNAFAGKKTLVLSSDEGFVSEIEKNLKDRGLSALLLKPESTSAEEIIGKMREKIDEIKKEYALNRLSKISDEYKNTKKALREYEDDVVSGANCFGMSLADAAESFVGANVGIEREKVLETNKKAFEGENALNIMFETAEELIVKAEKALISVNLDKYVPLIRHPLSAVKAIVNTEGSLEKGFDLIDKIISIISDYREKFLDIEDEINIGISEIKTQKALTALNELYKIIISARELDIPENFTEYDISVFADNSENFAKAKDRLENIEFQLRFMNKEIFEDVDILLADFSYNDGHNENFIKKYLIKKNNKDVLLQYVSPENRPEFNQHGVAEIYKLLGEYRKIRLSLDGYKNKVEYSENNVKLATLIKNVETELGYIYPESTSEFINRKTRKVFNFIEEVRKNPSIAKNLTYARAALTEVFSENECLMKVLSETLNVDFENIVFDAGILNYDGLTQKLRGMKTDKTAYEAWNEWLGAKEKAAGKMDSFAQYIEKSGITENIDRIFAKSLILPAYELLSGKIGYDAKIKQFDELKDKYSQEFAKAKETSAVNSYHAHMQKIKFFAETESLSGIYADLSAPAHAFVRAHLEALSTFFPCIVMSDKLLGIVSESGIKFDTVVLNEAEYEGIYAIPALSVSQSALVIGRNGGEISEKLASSGAEKYEMNADSENAYAFGANNEFQIITVNGSMRRSSDGANPQEAEACLAKAFEYAEKSKEKFCIYTFTNGQAAYIKHLIAISPEKDKLCENGKPICKVVCASDGICEKFERIILSVGAAPGANGSTGRNYFSSDNAKELVNKVFARSVKEAAVVTSMTLKDFAKMRRTSTHAKELYFMMYALHTGTKPYSADENSFGKSNISHKILENNPTLSRAGGKYGNKADFVDVRTNTFYMYDCTFGKDIPERISDAEELERAGYNVKFIPSAVIN